MGGLESLVGELEQKTAFTDGGVTHDNVFEDVAVGVGILHFNKEL